MRAILNNVIVKIDKAPEIVGGVVIPGKVQRPQFTGIVTSVGPQCKKVKKDDKVMFNIHTTRMEGRGVKYLGQEIYICEEKHITFLLGDDLESTEILWDNMLMLTEIEKNKFFGDIEIPDEYADGAEYMRVLKLGTESYEGEEVAGLEEGDLLWINNAKRSLYSINLFETDYFVGKWECTAFVLDEDKHAE